MSEDTRNLGQSVEAVSRRLQLLINENIALAKAEVAEKSAKLGKGAVIGIAAGFFALWGLLLLFMGLAVLISWAIGGAPFWGWLIVSLLLFALAAAAGLIAAKAVKAGAPPVPTMAIDEAKLIRDTVQSPTPAAVAPVAAKEG